VLEATDVRDFPVTLFMASVACNISTHTASVACRCEPSRDLPDENGGCSWHAITSPGAAAA
jgi:hypothetical protein